jgi:hypothetical protein
MPTTTNYGWTTPADTDLVKDGASAIRTLGTAIDTTVFNNASAAIAKTIVDAKGDIIAATAADTVSRLAVGANDTVLTADSSTATGLKWAAAAGGGMTLISTTSLTGASTVLSSIPQTYNSLFLVMYGVTNATADGVFAIEPNSSVNSAYTAVTNGTASTNTGSLRLSATTNPWRTDANNVWSVRYDNYTSTTNYKIVSWIGLYRDSNPDSFSVIGGGGFRDNTAITSLQIKNYGGNLSTGTALLYGVK